MTASDSRCYLGYTLLLFQIFLDFFDLFRCFVNMDTFSEETLHHELWPCGRGKEELLYKTESINRNHEQANNNAYGYPPVLYGFR